MQTAVVTTHANPVGLANLMEQLTTQTIPVDEILVYASGKQPTNYAVKRVPDRNDWGHEKRAMGLESATGGYVGFFNDDDYYTNDYWEKMLQAIGTHDIVFCNFRSHLYGNAVVYTEPKLGKCTSGNFIVRTEFAQAVGYNHRSYEADWLFINDLLEAGATWTILNEVLYHHN